MNDDREIDGQQVAHQLNGGTNTPLVERTTAKTTIAAIHAIQYDGSSRKNRLV